MVAKATSGEKSKVAKETASRAFYDMVNPILESSHV